MASGSPTNPFSTVKKFFSSLRKKLMSNPTANPPRYPEGHLYVSHGATKHGEDVTAFRAHGDDHAGFFRGLSITEVQYWKEMAEEKHEFLIIVMNGKHGITHAKTHRQVILEGRNSSETSLQAATTSIPSLDPREARDTIIIHPLRDFGQKFTTARLSVSSRRASDRHIR
jgi:hypothetical protein